MVFHLGASSIRPSILPSPATRTRPVVALAREDGLIREWILTRGRANQITKITPLTGGSKNSYHRYDTDAGPYFVKMSRMTDNISEFEVEALSQLQIFKTKSVRVPKPFKVGILPNGCSYFIMEFVEFGASRNNQAVFGAKLAEMHRDGAKKERFYGFELNNTIGSTPQINSWSTDWIDFYGQMRLGYQLQLVKEKYSDSIIYDKGYRLIDNMRRLFVGILIKPCLLHGDLWGRNIHCNQFGDPLVLDPASYYGHHEAEFGLSWRAFYGTTFFKAYFRFMPKQPGFERRRDLYKLYHYLNHYYMFGVEYRPMAMAIIDSYLWILKV